MSVYQVACLFVFGLNLQYLLLVCHLIFIFKNPDNYGIQSYRFLGWGGRNPLFKPYITVLMYLSAAVPKSQLYLGEQGRVHTTQQILLYFPPQMIHVIQS